MASRQQALKAIAAAGVTLDQDSADGDYYIIDAPVGYVFAANNEASYHAGVYDRFDAQYGFGPKMGEIYDDIVMACQMGIYKDAGKESK
jgi:hypothetical protein